MLMDNNRLTLTADHHITRNKRLGQSITIKLAAMEASSIAVHKGILLISTRFIRAGLRRGGTAPEAGMWFEVLSGSHGYIVLAHYFVPEVHLPQGFMYKVNSHEEF